MLLMKDFYNKKAQEEKIGSPVAIFKVERSGVSDKFKRVNKQFNNTLDRTISYPIYFEFTDADMPSIHTELIGLAEYQLRENEPVRWSSGGSFFSSDFCLFGVQELKNVIDYEYHITYEMIPQKEVKTDFSGIKKIEGIKNYESN